MSKVKRAKKVKNTAPQWILFFVFVAYEIFAILFSVNGIPVPISLVAAGIYSILEVLLSICLFRTPIYVHGLVIIGQLILGNVCKNLPLMIIFSILYFLSVVLLYYWTRDEKEKKVYVKKNKADSKTTEVKKAKPEKSEAKPEEKKAKPEKSEIKPEVKEAKPEVKKAAAVTDSDKTEAESDEEKKDSDE